MARQYEVISADSHLDLSTDQWRHHVPDRWRDQLPSTARGEDGEPSFQTGGGTGPPDQRLREQDQDGVEAEVLFSRGQQLRPGREGDAYLALIRAYNHYLVEEYSALAPDRLITMGLIPTSGVDDAIRELEYCKNAGLKGVGLEKFPSGRGLPSPEDDPFWAAALDLRMPVTHHTSGGATRMTGSGEATFLYPRGLNPNVSGPEWMRSDPMRHNLFRFCGEAACAPIQMAFAGVWDRFPALQIYWAETNIGWISYALWQIDEHYERYASTTQDLYGWDRLERMPSDYLRGHCLWGFLHDRFGVEQRAAPGTDKLMWGNDFPHVAGDWPNSRGVIEKNFAGIPGHERHLMLAGNAVRFFHLGE